MKRMVMALVGLLFAGPVAAEEANCMTDMVTAFEGALMAGNLDGIMGLYVDSNDVLVVESTGKVRRGREGIRAMYGDAFAEATWTKADFELIKTDLGDDEGFCFFRFAARGTLKGGTDEFALNVQGTWLVRNTKTGWKIFHEHMSPTDAVPRLEIIKTEAEAEAEAEPESPSPQD
ncbi:MAG: nuclear transport factor 2 family protein [Pseudomonadota bacterium]